MDRKPYRISLIGFEDDMTQTVVELSENEADAFRFVAEQLNDGGGATTPTMHVEEAA
ncbi:hypothetical protein [Micromonospora sp. WMMD1082]|uniref:hypothetical protein n=1 Tax=Micromonospora sp. WMMD1082 TaxID=3016104 RepID=UPI002417E860|nr:hypothetical protein [Micromonospora sp. WMMD1082]MDG4792726.1 hypothetical protein [Micromonospora sp. WMMD1082]